MKHLLPLTIVFAFLTAGFATAQDAKPVSYKPRVINTTDLGADPDDEQSMVRQLVCANEFDIEGLIVSTGCWKKKQSNTKMLDKLVDAYAECYDNLKVHADGFPTVEYLRSISVMGQKGYGMSDVGDGKDSPGSELIIASVDKDDPRPVWVGAWGGANNVAQAIWKVRATRSKEELDKFLSKLRVFDILGQDDAGAWITKNFPEVLYIRAVKVYGWQPPKNGDYQRKDIQSHGPLGAVYPDTKWATEGDTPAFMHVYPNGLNDPDQIDQGGWGGRFSWKKQVSIKSMRAVKQEERRYDPYAMYGNTPDGTSAIKRWSKGYDNDFAARMDWSITGKYEDANHHPVAIVNGDKSRRVLQVSAAPGEKVTLSAEGSSDPDKDALTYAWSFYDEPSSYDGSVEIASKNGTTATVSVPSNAAGKNLHIILELHDDGAPNLYAYRRVIINVSGTTVSSTGAKTQEPVAGAPYSPLPKKVVVTKVEHFGNMCWKIAAAGGTWYFENGETDGKSGFSSAFDQAGNDWIGNDADKGFNKSPSRGGRHEYRGWPNFGEGNFDHPQRKSGTRTRWVDARGDDVDFNGKLEGDHLIMRSANANYELEYHFFPSHAAIKVLKATRKYAFLFEGPIGGEQEASLDKDYYVLKDGKHRECKSGGLGYLEPEFGNDFPSPFFYLADSDPNDTQVWYAGVKNAGPESAGDEGWRQGQNMVIFSFGRDQDKRAYTGTDAVCVFGFHAKGDHGAISNFIESRLAAPFAEAEVPVVPAVERTRIAAVPEPASATPTSTADTGPSLNAWLKHYIATTYPDATFDDHGGWQQAHVGDLVVSWAEWNEPGLTLKGCEAHALKDGKSIFVSKNTKQDWAESDTVVHHNGAGYYIAGYSSAAMSNWKVEKSTILQFDGDAKSFTEKMAAAWSKARKSKPDSSATQATVTGKGFDAWLRGYIPKRYPDAEFDDHGGWAQARFPNLKASWAEWEPGILLKQVHDIEEGESIFVSKSQKDDWPESDSVIYVDGAGYYIAGYDSATMSEWNVGQCTVVQFDGDSRTFSEDVARAFTDASRTTGR